MMYVFICPSCGKVRMVSAVRQLDCRKCHEPMANCELSFTDWVNLSVERRNKMIKMYQMAEVEKLCYYRPMPHYDPRERGYW